jgi:hypothetical protein
VPCCDCNGDDIIDVADAVCVVNGIGELVCPTVWAAHSSGPTTDLPGTVEGMSQSTARDRPREGKSHRTGIRSRLDAGSRIDLSLSLEQHDLGDSVVVPLIFRQGRGDGLPGGPDEVTAFSICLDFDQEQLEFDASDEDSDGIPDALGLQVPSSHSPLVSVDLTRQHCELQIGMVDFSAPSEPLQDGTLAEIQFRRIGNESEGIWVHPVMPVIIETQSFSDVQGVSLRGHVREADEQGRTSEAEED